MVRMTLGECVSALENLIGADACVNGSTIEFRQPDHAAALASLSLARRAVETMKSVDRGEPSDKEGGE